MSPQGQPSPRFRLLLPKILQELEFAVAEVGAKAWEGVERARAAEIAGALASACRAEGLREAATLPRSLESVLRLSREQIAPIEGAFGEDVREILKCLRPEGERALKIG